MKTTLFLCFLVILVSCGSSNDIVKKSTPIYFEGVIEYATNYESLSANMTSEFLNSYLSQRHTCYFKDGNFVNFYYHNDTLFRKGWYNRESNTFYFHTIMSDTIYYYDAGVCDSWIDAITKGPNEVIDGKNAIPITVLARGKEDTSMEGNNTKATRWNSPDLPINPLWYSNYRESAMDKSTNLVPGLAVKSELIIYNNWKVTQTATKIEWKTVELDLSVDSTKTLVYF